MEGQSIVVDDLIDPAENIYLQKSVNGQIGLNDAVYLSDDDEKELLSGEAEKRNAIVLPEEDDDQSDVDQEEENFDEEDDDDQPKRKGPSQNTAMKKPRAKRGANNNNKKAKPTEPKRISNMRKERTNSRTVEKKFKQFKNFDGPLKLDSTGQNSALRASLMDNDRVELKLDSETANLAAGWGSSKAKTIRDGTNVFVSAQIGGKTVHVHRAATGAELGLDQATVTQRNGPPVLGNTETQQKFEQIINS
jgi:hypothetical protein